MIPAMHKVLTKHLQSDPTLYNPGLFTVHRHTLRLFASCCKSNKIESETHKVNSRKHQGDEEHRRQESQEDGASQLCKRSDTRYESLQCSMNHSLNYYTEYNIASLEACILL